MLASCALDSEVRIALPSLAARTAIFSRVLPASLQPLAASVALGCAGLSSADVAGIARQAKDEAHLRALVLRCRPASVKALDGLRSPPPVRTTAE